MSLTKEEHREFLRGLGIRAKVVGVRHFVEGKPAQPATPEQNRTNLKTLAVVAQVLARGGWRPMAEFVGAGISPRTARTELLRRMNLGEVVARDTNLRRKKEYRLV